MSTSRSIIDCLIDERPGVLLKLPSIVEEFIPKCTSLLTELSQLDVPF